jgi:hypothetical protein
MNWWFSSIVPDESQEQNLKFDNRSFLSYPFQTLPLEDLKSGLLTASLNKLQTGPLHGVGLRGWLSDELAATDTCISEGTANKLANHEPRCSRTPTPTSPPV